MFRRVVFVWILKVQSTNFMSRTAHAYNVNTLVGQTFTREGERVWSNSRHHLGPNTSIISIVLETIGGTRLAVLACYLESTAL